MKPMVVNPRELPKTLVLAEPGGRKKAYTLVRAGKKKFGMRLA